MLFPGGKLNLHIPASLSVPEGRPSFPLLSLLNIRVPSISSFFVAQISVCRNFILLPSYIASFVKADTMSVVFIIISQTSIYHIVWYRDTVESMDMGCLSKLMYILWGLRILRYLRCYRSIIMHFCVRGKQLHNSFLKQVQEYS